MTAFLRDLRQGARQLIRRPGFSAAAIASLALGIGLNTTLFSVVNAVLLKNSPVSRPDRLVEIYTGLTDVRETSDIVSVVGAVAPKPVNVLVGSDFSSVAELGRLGVRRISVGGALARAAWTGFVEAATEIADRGTFRSLGRAVSFAEINGRFTPR